ncbi:3-keto-5-aminohexanoate cleavage protein [Pseudomaricurvus alkylphenolicus]|uniref:3-keto-5-aminohexanoate cleavage protein n=1 Tax=Pseudomaricurvus alkylphenolicus TaxID=1306991 RepID=UPI001421862F|nr:3-keto-5-aminohexanoate cleavage protein [Pseudomaricurvus alkylphenolicus]NIB42475.1 3-keto-5-aminohexanoate cleavage protein [Pseudomaricurvus alkylphenolicus]
MRNVILTCAVTGNLTRPDQTPYLPISPKQIAEACLGAAEAGAAVVHIHVRYPDGSPSMEVAHYGEVVERIREQNRSLIINLTTGQGGRFVPDAEDPKIAAPETQLLPPLERIQHVLELKPEICTLDLNTMNSGDMIVMNTRPNTRIMAEAMLAAGVKPEIEIFNGGDMVLANEHVANLGIASPVMYSFVMGVKYSWPAMLETIQLGKSMLPENALWTAFGIGRHEFPVVAQSVLMGGHIRVGMEDNLFIEKGVLAKSNAELCEKACRIVRDLGYEIASAETARDMLKL